MTAQAPTDITLEQVRALSITHIGRLPANAEPDEAYGFVGLQIQGSYQRSIVSERLMNRISDAFGSGHKAIHRHIRKLLDQLVFDHHAYSTALEPTYSLLSAIRDGVSSQSYGEATGNFEAAIEAAADYVRWTDAMPADDQLYYGRHRETIALAAAVMRLRKKFAEKSHDIEVLKTRQAASIEKMAIQMGGIEIVKRLFKTLEPKWDSQQERYHDVLEIPALTQPLVPRMPTNYLLDLAVKHPYPKKPIRRSDEDWRRLVQESKELAVLYKVQSTSYLETIFIDHLSLLDQLVKKALEDSFFRVPQQRPSDIQWVLKTLADCCELRKYVDVNDRAGLNATIAVIEAIQRHVNTQRGPVIFSASSVASHCENLQIAEINQILRERLSHPPRTANQNFFLPDEIPDDSVSRKERCGSNFGDRPLVCLEEDRYWMVDKAVCAPAFVEVLLSQLRDLRVSEEKLGLAFEDMVCRTLSEHGIDAVSGTYEDSGKTWECDLVFETADCVFFVEAKKKALTRKSRAGMTLGVLLDIGQSMAHAVLQGVRHERKLRKDQRLELTLKDGTTRVIDLAGRSVEVLAATLQDFGGFHDRTLLDRVLAAQTMVTFSVDDPSYKKKITELNEHIEQLRTVVSELTNLRPSRRGMKGPAGERLGGEMPFMNCWFLGLPHLMVALDGVSCAAEFQKSLFLTRHSTYQASDFYFDRLEMHRLNQINRKSS